MEQITVTILTLLALYILYSECIKLPKIIKQNKKLCYLVIGGIFLYYCSNRNVETFLDRIVPSGKWGPFENFWSGIVTIASVCLLIIVIFGLNKNRDKPYVETKKIENFGKDILQKVEDTIPDDLWA